MNEVDFINETEQIRKAVGLINAIDDVKFRLLLQRILQKIHLINDTYFKEDELEKLITNLNLTNRTDLNLLINTIEFIYLQSAYLLIKPQILNNNLLKLFINEAHVSLIVDLWRENAKELIEKLREQRTISYMRLNNIKWRLNIQLASDSKTKMKYSNAIIDFEIAGKNQENENILVEFSKDELYDFYLKLETIQEQLDNLNK